MDIEKAVSILMEAGERMEKEAGVKFVHTYSLRTSGSDHPVFVAMFSDSQAACDNAIRTIEVAN